MEWPVYLESYRSGKLKEKVGEAYQLLAFPLEGKIACALCPRYCKVNRQRRATQGAVGKLGACGVGDTLFVSSAFPHFGEEDPLRGWNGSGTIFFSQCNMKCVFCQNWETSHGPQDGKAGTPGGPEGRFITPSDLARMMFSLQEQGCHNINWVTPTHQLPMILDGLEIAVGMGLRLPIVYNCGGYESLESARLLEGVVDIYMPDFKWWREESARRYSRAPGYPEAARNALKEMQRQVGPLEMTHEGVARRGLLIRHLVMPGFLEETKEILSWIAQELGKDTYVNLMAQYRPQYKAFNYPGIDLPIPWKEYNEAVEWAEKIGLTRLDGRTSARRKGMATPRKLQIFRFF